MALLGWRLAGCRGIFGTSGMAPAYVWRPTALGPVLLGGAVLKGPLPVVRPPACEAQVEIRAPLRQCDSALRHRHSARTLGMEAATSAREDLAESEKGAYSRVGDFDLRSFCTGRLYPQRP